MTGFPAQERNGCNLSSVTELVEGEIVGGSGEVTVEDEGAENRVLCHGTKQVQRVAPEVRVDICKEKSSIASKAHSTHGRTNNSKTATATYTIFEEGLYRAHFSSFIARKVVARKIK